MERFTVAMSIALVGWCAFGAVACSSATSGGPPLATDGGATAIDGNPALPSSEGGSTTPPESRGADAGDAGTDHPASGGPFHPYAVGRGWTWQGKNNGGRDITETAQVTGIVEVDGRLAFILDRTTTGYGFGSPTRFTSYAAVDGDNEWTRGDFSGATWLQSQKAPLVDGTSWSTDGSTYTYKREPAQTVPAGTFDDCWRIMLRTVREPTQVDDTIVCRGVGLVRVIRSNPSGASLDLHLVKKNF